MNKKIKNTVKIISVIGVIGTLVLSYIKFFTPEKEPVVIPKVEIKGNGDNVNRDKIINNNINTTIIQETQKKPIQETPKKPIQEIQKKPLQKTLEKPVEKVEEVKKKETPNINGIVNNASNYGSQTVISYGSKQEPRTLNADDINKIKSIPKRYSIHFNYATSTKESVKYAKEVKKEIIKLGYKITDSTRSGLMSINYSGDEQFERIDLMLDHDDKLATVSIGEQK